MDRVAGVLFFCALLFVNFAPAYAPSAPRVNGRYIDTSSGFDIQFPQGWIGTFVDGRYPLVHPPHLPQSDGSTNNVSISVMPVNRLEVKNLITSGLDDIVRQQNLDSGSNNNNCKKILAELVPVSGITVFHTIVKCTVEQEQARHEQVQQQPMEKNNTTSSSSSSSSTTTITDSYIFFTLTKSIVVSYFAESEAAYEKYLSDFASSLQTTRLDEPVNLRSALEVVLGITKFYKKTIESQKTATATTTAANHTIDMIIGTSSATVDAGFSNGNGTSLVINVNEQTRQNGRLLIPVDKVLHAPYQVYIDGEPVPDPLVISDTQTNETLVLVEYDEGKHRIAISEAHVAPEFSLPLMGILVPIFFATLILYHRKKGERDQGSYPTTSTLRPHSA
jgi:hypothetical protein